MGESRSLPRSTTVAGTPPAAQRRAQASSLGMRAVSSAALIVAVVASIRAPVGPFAAVATLFVAIGLWEYFDLLERKGLHAFRWVGLFIGCGIPALSALAAGAPAESWARESVALWLLAGALTVCVVQFVRRESRDALVTVACTVFGILYVAWLFSFLVRLKVLPRGAELVGFVVAVTKLGDMGAYFVGSALGKRPLIPRISPRKTVEGLIGGVLASVGSACLLRGWLPTPAWGHALLLGVLLGIGVHVGDLIESLFKRDCDTKDSGQLVPGLGGLLDVIDSLLFTIPVFYAYVRIAWF